MPNLLAIDTSSTHASLALVSSEGTLALQGWSASTQLSRTLLPAIEQVLAGAGCERRALDALAVSIGPGAFTGLRVGIATAQGLALALRRPCFGIDVLDAWIAAHPPAGEAVVVLDAFRGELLAAKFHQGRRQGEPRCQSPEELLRELPLGCQVVGAGAQPHAVAWRSLRPDLVWPAPAPDLAPAVGRLGLSALDLGLEGAPSSLRPIYLRPAFVQPA